MKEERVSEKRERAVKGKGTFADKDVDLRLLNCLVRLQIPLFSEQDNFLLKRGLRIIF